MTTFNHIQSQANHLKAHEIYEIDTKAGLVQVKAKEVFRHTNRSNNLTLAISYKLNGKRISVANLQEKLA